MKLVIEATAKKIVDTVPGELIHSMVFDQFALSVVLDKRDDDGDAVLLAIVKGSGTDHPVLKYGDTSDNCLSYGRDWYLHLDHAKLGVDHGAHTTGYGTMAFTKDGAILKLESGQGGGEWWSLSTGSPVRPPSKFMNYAGWSVWASLDDWANPRSSCLGSFPAVA